MLIVIDALRADALPEGGFFSRLARGGVTFESCVSTAPWTLPSMASVLTSLLPTEHGTASPDHALSDGALTLAEVFRSRGYQTAAFSGGGFVTSAFGLDQGFETFDPSSEQTFYPYVDYVPLSWRIITSPFCPLPSPWGWIDTQGGIRGLRVAAERWAGRRDRHRPAFVLLHTYEVHDYFIYHATPDDSRRPATGLSERFRGRLSVRPSELRGASQGDLDWFREVYDHRIPYTENEIEHLVETHVTRSRRELIVALTSDHGEGFDSVRGRVTHGGRLHEDLVHVPLILYWPGKLPAGRRVPEPVSTLDVMPTLLELAGFDDPPGISGRSLIPLVSDGVAYGRSLWSEDLSGPTASRSLRRGDWKLHDLPDGVRAFDLRDDPLEDHALSAPEALLHELRSFEDRFSPRPPGRAVIDDANLAHLRELGYLEDAPPEEIER